MTTTNIVSTPNITGNIGSCTTQAEQVITKDGFWSTKGFTITTNSCTGTVNNYDYYQIGFGSLLLGALAVILLIIIGIDWLANR